MAGISEDFQGRPGSERLVLGVDTCGLMGSVALGRICGLTVEIVGEAELEGRSYSATLVAAVGNLLAQAGLGMQDLGAIVAVNGPGSFTGVRVGLSAVKGLAEPARIPVVAVSRLEVLAWKAGVGPAALDAHRNEVFLRVPGPDGEATELLAGLAELRRTPPPYQIAVSDETAAVLLASAWPEATLLRIPTPTAADAMQLAAPGVLAEKFVDLARLDGHYLRRSDAEIFAAAAKVRGA
jgi:tRNA threonylcarbamoyladenosine biosynthesis protein TsaB